MNSKSTQFIKGFGADRTLTTRWSGGNTVGFKFSTAEEFSTAEDYLRRQSKILTAACKLAVSISKICPKFQVLSFHFSEVDEMLDEH